MSRILPLMTALLLAATPALADEPITGGEWTLLAIDGKKAPAPATLTLSEDGTVGGQAPCNSYFTANTATLPALAFDAIGSTKMACPDLGAEADYLSALQTMTAAELKDGHLILTGADGRRLEFYRAETEDKPPCLSCPKAA